MGRAGLREEMMGAGFNGAGEAERLLNFCWSWGAFKDFFFRRGEAR